MLLKPATPLTVLLLAAFVLLLLSTLSTPIIKGIPLATFENVDFGVFGWCKGSQCSNIRVGYNTNGVLGNGSKETGDLNLTTSARNSLSSILIVHPVAAFLTLICLVMAAAAHFRSPSHSPRYLLALLILLLPTVLVSLLAFLVDILLFVPHLQWGGWIVLAATIILVSCGVVTCAMRRTLVSRKARKRRIAENAEMSGENFYNRQNAEATATFARAESPPALSAEQKAPLVSGNASSLSGPTFVTFDSSSRGPEEDQVPLNSRTPASNVPLLSDDGLGRYGPPGRADYPPRDEYGNPRGPSDPRLRNQFSDSSMGSRRGGPPRGPGGYPMRGGYGRGGPYGGRGRGFQPNGRGGPIRGGPGMMMGRGRGPPPGYPQGRGGPPGGYDPYGPPGAGRRPSPFNGPGYGPDAGDYGYGPRGPPPGGPMRRPSAPGMPLDPVLDGIGPGQAIEMTSQPNDPNFPPSDLLRPPERDANQDTLESPSSVYSGNEPYIPPRAAWDDVERREDPQMQAQPQREERAINRSPGPRPMSGDDYYEDVDPRFAEPREAAPSSNAVPSLLVPGPGPAGEKPPPLTIPDENVADGPRSPAASEISQFTSISERPVNPLWQPPPMPRRGPLPQRQDVLLVNNPDFEVPVGRGQGGRVGHGGPMIPPMPDIRGSGRYPSPS